MKTGELSGIQIREWEICIWREMNLSSTIISLFLWVVRAVNTDYSAKTGNIIEKKIERVSLKNQFCLRDGFVLNGMRKKTGLL